MKVLVAEDDSVSRLLLASILEKLGYEVLVTENGHDAWLAYEQEKSSLIITDWMMPALSGLDLCRRIRAHHNSTYTYIILLTALGGRDYYLEGMDAGADDFMTKPFDKEKLASRLRVAQRVLTLKAEVKQLEDLLPICPVCKKIQETEHKWTPVEDYLSKRTDAFFSHSVCPECYTSQVEPQLEQLRHENIRFDKRDKA